VKRRMPCEAGFGESAHDGEGGKGRRRGMDHLTRLGVSVNSNEDGMEMAGGGDVGELPLKLHSGISANYPE
jgi:hypothetical protein